MLMNVSLFGALHVTVTSVLKALFPSQRKFLLFRGEETIFLDLAGHLTVLGTW